MSIKYAILGILSRAPAHGYAVRSKLHALVGDFWPINQGQVYATLSRMASRGQIAELATTEQHGSELRPYAIGPRGRNAYAAWLARPTPPRRRSELLVKLAFLLSRHDRAGCERLVAEQRARCRSDAAALRRAGRLARRRRAGLEPGELVRRSALAHIAAELDWLDLVVRELHAPSRGRGRSGDVNVVRSRKSRMIRSQRIARSRPAR